MFAGVGKQQTGARARANGRKLKQVVLGLCTSCIPWAVLIIMTAKAGSRSGREKVRATPFTDHKAS
jgi:hypothetical protein